MCRPKAGRKSLELGFPHWHHPSPLVLILISRQQACLRSSWCLWSGLPLEFTKLSGRNTGIPTTKSLVTLDNPYKHVLWLNSSPWSSYWQLDSAAQTIHTCYFSVYSGIQHRQSGLLNTSFECKAERPAAAQKKMAFSREKRVFWGN